MGSQDLLEDSHLSCLLFGVPLIVAVAAISITRWCLRKLEGQENNNTLSVNNNEKKALSLPLKPVIATENEEQKEKEEIVDQEKKDDDTKETVYNSHRALKESGSIMIAQRDSFDSSDEEPITAYTGLCKLCFSVAYDPVKEVLTVHLIRGMYFSLKNSIPSLFVRLHLLPDKKKKHHSRTHKSCSPEFNEYFTIPLLRSEFHVHVVELVVLTHDRFHLSHIIGHIHFPLADNLNTIEQNGGTGQLWRGIEEHTSKPAVHKGEICVLMSYFPNANYITVTLMEGKGIQVEDLNAVLAIKVSLVYDGKLMKMKKTMSESRDVGAPIFNETFVFEVQQEMINHLCVIFAVCLYPHKGPKSVLGRVIIGSVMYANGEGLEHWSEVQKHPQQTFRRWHEIV